jgi:hypothetical protein
MQQEVVWRIVIQFYKMETSSYTWKLELGVSLNITNISIEVNAHIRLSVMSTND